MPTFHYLPPGAEEQKTFALQFLGTLLCCVLLGALFWFSTDTRLKAVLFGAASGVLWLLMRAALQLEKKAQRAQNSEFEIDDDGVVITNARGQQHRVLWNEIQELNVVGGRLTMTWNDDELSVGARELENGMEFVREITRRYQQEGGEVGKSWTPPTNFIPLDPK